MPCWTVLNSDSACLTRLTVAAGASGFGLLEPAGVLAAVDAGALRRRQGRLGLRQLLLRVDDGLLRRDGRLGPRHGILPRLLQVGARILDVADGRGGLAEHVAVPVQRRDVGRARAAELRRLVREVGLGVREGLLASPRPGPRPP